MIKLQKVGGWLLEWRSDRPHTVWAIPEYLKTIKRSDSGILYDNGAMAWNWPESTPAYVRHTAYQFIVKCRRETI